MWNQADPVSAKLGWDGAGTIILNMIPIGFLVKIVMIVLLHRALNKTRFSVPHKTVAPIMVLTHFMIRVISCYDVISYDQRIYT